MNSWQNLKNMNRFLAILLFSLLLQSCNDGDIIITTFNFDKADLKTCGSVGNYVFYKVNPQAQESLSLKLSFADSLYKIAETKVFTLDGTTNFVNYRNYDGALGSGYFCSSIPPTSPIVTVDYLGASGTANVATIFVFDDNDGVPFEFEKEGDTDGDGIPDYYDDDDDGDNVPTALELDTKNEDGDNNPLTQPLDTDGDGIPDYLDADDDGDFVITRYEDKNMNLDPTDDKTDPTVGADYLNPAIADTYEVNLYRQHKYNLKKSVQITLKNLVLTSGEEKITIETLDMGTIENIETVAKTKTPTL